MEFYSVTDRKGEEVNINLYQVVTVRLTVDDYGKEIFLIRMTNGDSIYLSVDMGAKVAKKCAKK